MEYIVVPENCKFLVQCGYAMLTFLFWNLCGVGLKSGDERYALLQKLLNEAATTYTFDVLVLAESPFAGSLVIQGFVEAKTLLPIADCRLEIYHRETISLKPLRGVGRGTVQEVSVKSTGVSFLLAALHFDSALYDTNEIAKRERQDKAIKFADVIHQCERLAEVNHCRTVVVGDFNYEPYDLPLVWSLGFHSVTTKAKAKQKIRRNDLLSLPYFYNPMWRHYGDTISGPSGTFCHEGSWKMPDQVLVRAELLNVWKDTNLEILSAIGSTPLVGRGKMPKKKSDKDFVSDHLPLIFSLDL